MASVFAGAPPSLDGLELLVAVGRLGSISRAARALGITQPSATSRLRTLERQLGCVLLERTPVGCTPTPRGAQVIEVAAEVLESAMKLRRVAAGGDVDTRAAISIGASYTIAEFLLPLWLVATAPDAAARIEVANSQEVLAGLTAGTLDIGFIESPDVPHGFEAEVVACDELLLVTAPSHPWAGRRSPVGAAELAGAAYVMREPESGTRQYFERGLRAAGFPAPREIVALSSSSSVKEAVIAGIGPAVLSEHVVDTDLRLGRLVRVDVEGIDLRRELRAVWPSGRALSPAAQRLLRSAQAGGRRPQDLTTTNQEARTVP